MSQHLRCRSCNHFIERERVEDVCSARSDVFVKLELELARYDDVAHRISLPQRCYPGVCGCGCQTDVAWWAKLLLPLIARIIRCQKACNRLATHPLAKVLSANPSRVTERGNMTVSGAV